MEERILKSSNNVVIFLLIISILIDSINEDKQLIQSDKAGDLVDSQMRFPERKSMVFPVVFFSPVTHSLSSYAQYVLPHPASPLA